MPDTNLAAPNRPMANGSAANRFDLPDPMPVDRIREVAHALRSSPEQPWSLEDLAEMACYSRYHFSRLFAQETGVSPVQFQTAHRFRYARDLLLTTDLPIIDVCDAVGYQGLGTFTSRFRQFVGVSPSMFRELPHRIAGARFGDETLIMSAGGPAVIDVSFALPAPESQIPEPDSVYVGVYPAAAAAGRPITGTWTRPIGPVSIAGVPAGRWVLLAAAYQRPIDGLGHLHSASPLVTGGTAPFTVQPSHGVTAQRITLEPPGPLSAPVLTALPALLLAILDGRVDRVVA